MKNIILTGASDGLGKEFADMVATEQILIPNAGHINSESGYDKFEDIVSYL